MSQNPKMEKDTGMSSEIDEGIVRLLPGLFVESYQEIRTRFTAGPMPAHLLIVKFIDPAQVIQRPDTRNSRDDPQGGPLHAEIDLFPSGSAITWEGKKTSRALRFHFTAAQLQTTGLKMGLNPDTIELLPQFGARDTQIEHIAAAISHALDCAILLKRPYGESLGTALLSRIIAKFGEARSEKEKKILSRTQINAIFDYIDRHVCEKILVNDLAGITGLSVPYFRKLFQQAVGLPVHQYLIQHRVTIAQNLLRKGRTISQAAAETGFADQSHLARSMRRIIGFLPSEIIRLNKQNRPASTG